MWDEKKYYVYILSNKWNNVLYVGMTGRWPDRIAEHKEGKIDGFTKRYNVKKLVCYEDYDTPMEAIEREKQIKGWRREKKVWLINQMNPEWIDLYYTLI